MKADPCIGGLIGLVLILLGLAACFAAGCETMRLNRAARAAAEVRP